MQVLKTEQRIFQTRGCDIQDDWSVNNIFLNSVFSENRLTKDQREKHKQALKIFNNISNIDEISLGHTPVDITILPIPKSKEPWLGVLTT